MVMDMDRAEFMRQLEILLQDIAAQERREALQYYNDYFHDAGAENEQDVIAALGTPARVAQNIKRDLSGGHNDAIYEKAESGRNAIVTYGQPADEDAKGDAQAYGNAQGSTQAQSDAKSSTQSDAKSGGENPAKSGLSAGMLALIILLGILASPILLGGGAGLLGIAVGIAAIWFCLILGFGVAALVLICMLFVLLIGGVLCLGASPAYGIGIIGGGLICGGLGLGCLMAAVALAGVATPAICRGVGKLWRSLFEKQQRNP